MITNIQTSKVLGEGLGYLSYFDIKEDIYSERIAELVRFKYSETMDHKPYIKITLKDVNGVLVYGAWYDYKINEDVLRNFSKYTKVYVSLKYYATLWNGIMHLKIKDMVFLDDEETTKELQKAFIAELPNREVYLDKLLTDDYGDYTVIKQTFEKIGLFKAIYGMHMSDCGSAKAGELLRICNYVFDQINYANICGPLAKLMSLYTLYFYASEVNTKTFEIQVNITNVIRKFDQQAVTFKSKFKGTPYEDMVIVLFEESERLLCKLIGMPITSSVSVEVISDSIKKYDELYRLSTYYNSAPKNTMISVNGGQILNI